MLDQPGCTGIGDAHRADAFVGVQRICADAERGLDAVLQQPVDDDDVATHQFLAAGHSLPGDEAVMHDELEVEPRDEDARVAVALRCLADIAQTSAEGDVTVLDRVLESGPVDFLGEDIGEGSVALELCQPKRRPERPNDGVREVGQDVLRVVEFDTGEITGVPADIGDDEAGGFRSVGHDDPLRR